jgi:hypothetical protein
VPPWFRNLLAARGTTSTMRVLIRLGGAYLFLIGAALPVYADAIGVTRAMQASTIAGFFVKESGVQVELLDVDWRRLPGGRGFDARCTWNVSGSVGQWGHIHQRTNQYQAELTVHPEAGGWKFTDLHSLKEERL